MKNSVMLLLLLSLVVFGCIVVSQEQTFTKFFTPVKGEDFYQYIAIDVPEGIQEIQVEYTYEKSDNTIDIGIFDVRGTTQEGFRGWSGGKRSEFVISHTWATPGYIAGTIYPGKWHVILGLYNIAPQGVTVQFRVIFRKQPTHQGNLSAPWDSEQILNHKSQWYRGDLHMHTEHSDGDQTMAELLQYAKENQLDFLGLTEHNTSSHHFEMPTHKNPDVLLIAGEEVTTRKGHANVWGIPQGHWVDFRMTPEYEINDMIREVHSVGGVFSVNHPFALCSGCYWTHFDAQNVDSIEVWNGFWDPSDFLAVQTWDKLLQQGKKITAIGSSDSHKMESPIGEPTTHVYAKNLSQREILQGIKDGKAFITKNPYSVTLQTWVSFQQQKAGIGETLYLENPQKIFLHVQTEGFQDEQIKVIQNGERIFTEKVKDLKQPIEIDVQKSGYLRLEFSGNAGMVALTNPIYIEIR